MPAYCINNAITPQAPIAASSSLKQRISRSRSSPRR